MREMPVKIAHKVALQLEVQSVGRKTLTVRMLWRLAQGKGTGAPFNDEVQAALQPVADWLEREKRIGELELERDSLKAQNNSLLDRLTEVNALITQLEMGN